jgi:Cu+-exporting ATPase
MDGLEEFANQIERTFAASRNDQYRQPGRTVELMAEFTARRSRFDEIAQRIVDTILRPRIEVLAAKFPNAQVVKTELGDGYICRFGYCGRFPSNARCQIALDHDESIEQVIIYSERHMRPTFLKFDDQDELAMPVDGVEEGKVISWIETKLLAFIKAYLRHDRGDDNVAEETAVDPVCGMRVRCTSPAATADFKGHLYYFCTEECSKLFVENPSRYIQFEPDW